MEGDGISIDLGDLDLTGQDVSFEDADGHIQANLEDEHVKEALEKGLDLRKFSQQIEEELLDVERESVNDYLKESKNMAELHVQIQNCDIILERMEQMLGLFQGDLGNISEEIQSLQEQSLSMNVKLKNRKAVQASLTDYVSFLSISDALVDTICNKPINESFLEALDSLDKKLAYVVDKPSDTASLVQINADLATLTQKASIKIRDYVLRKINSVKKPMASLELQQNALLKIKDAFKFLAKHNKPAAIELKKEYIETFSKVHYSYFKTYLARLLKLQHEEMADKDDTMGASDQKQQSGLGSLFSSGRPSKSRTSVFTLGDRGAVLNELETPILVPHTAKDGKGKDPRHPYESLFRSLHMALRDACAREFLFCVDFFRIKESAAKTFFDDVMDKTLMHLLKAEESHIEVWFDSISVVLCCRILAAYKAELLQKNIPCLETFYTRLLGMLWPRFTQIVALHASSIEAVDAQRLTNMDTRPHYIVRRYAEFSGALLELNDNNNNFKEITDGLSRLRQEVANFILRMAAEFPNRREQLILSINNYDMMISVYAERTTARSQESEEFEQLLQSCIREFSEEALQAAFGGIFTFVKDTERALTRASDPGAIRVDESRIQSLIQRFARDWKSAITTMEGDIMKTFTNFKNGTAILQTSLAHLVLMYDRFLAILKNPPFKRNGGWPDLIDKHLVKVEVKKHKTTF
eukprot:m.191310 g.191310  ORF g.191310 m.191310 type:complete len:698 (+) comp32425_c0_seq1:236-2329(+)